MKNTSKLFYLPLLLFMLWAFPLSAYDLNGTEFDVQGHRGAKGPVPPGNTLPSFQEGITIGVDTLEADMKIAADNTVIISHDDEISWACVWAGGGSAPSSYLSAMTASEVAGWDCHSELAGIQPHPTLEQLLDLHTGNSVDFNIEFKLQSDSQVDTFMTVVTDYNTNCSDCLEGRIIVQCYTYSACDYAKTNYNNKAAYGNFTFRAALLASGSYNFASIQNASGYGGIYSPWEAWTGHSSSCFLSLRFAKYESSF